MGTIDRTHATEEMAAIRANARAHREQAEYEESRRNARRSGGTEISADYREIASIPPPD